MTLSRHPVPIRKKETTMTQPSMDQPMMNQPPMAKASMTHPDIRSFSFTASDEALADLRRRVAAMHWPEKETVTDESQGVQLATIRELARYWASDYDWRKVEAGLHSLPQFLTQLHTPHH